MPTENRSSNTEMVSVPRELADRIQRRLDLAASAFKAAKPERDQFRAILDQPADQHQGDPIMLTAVATLADDGDGGLEASWLLEGGTAELFAGMTLLVAENAPELCHDTGNAELYSSTNAPIEPGPWQPLSAPGQIREGDWLSFTVAGSFICAQARLVIDPGTANEEIVYNRQKNHYFVTSMAVDGTSSHKGVLVAKAVS